LVGAKAKKISTHTGGALLRDAPVSAQCELSASCLDPLMKKIQTARRKLTIRPGVEIISVSRVAIGAAAVR